MLTLTAAHPALLFEGQGTGGSRPALLVIEGTNIVKQNTTVTIAKSAGETKTPMVMVDNAQLDVSADSAYLAVPVTLPVDKTGLAAADMVKLDITVTQDGPGGPISKTLTAAVTVQGLDELEGGPQTALSGDTTYSLVNLTGVTSGGSPPASTVKAATSTMPLVIRSTGSLKITNSVMSSFDVSGSGQNGGPAGGSGGAGGSVLGPGTPGTGPAAGVASGAAGGFTSDVTIYTLGDPFRGSGGAGTVATLGGGNGGGGGGSIMLSADGNLDVGGGAATGGATTGSGSSAGGGGSGGVIVLRAGGTLNGGAMNVAGSAGSSTGAAGRVRYDARGAVTLMNASSYFRGPTFVDPPLIATTERPTLMVAGTKLTTFKYFITNATGQMVNGPFTGNIPETGPATVSFDSGANDKLFPGLNQVCLVAGAGDASSDTRNCVSIANISHL